MAREWDPRLTQRGVQLSEFKAQGTQTLWQLVMAQYLDEQQSQGKHNVFVDVLNEQGQRQVGIPVEFSWADGKEIKNTEVKTDHAYALDFPMYTSGHSYNVHVATGVSDRVMGMGLGSIAEPRQGIHVSYRLVFQRTLAGGNGPGILPPPDSEPVLPELQPPVGNLWPQTVEWILQWEGGYQNNPDDHGNWTGGRKGVGELKGTKYGISAASFPTLDIANLTREHAIQLYFNHYWLPSGAHQLAWPLCLLVMDTAVLHGVGTARNWLNEIGPNPFGFAAKRLHVYTRLDNWNVFGAGWVNRTADLLEAMK